MLTRSPVEMKDSNDNERLIDELANLLNETAEAHHKAFAATEGEDPNWPLWYADYLLKKMRQMLKAKFTKSELIYLLVSADKKNGVVAPGAYWPRFYAKYFVNRYL
jgi:NAD(P)H-hydrate epimerase